MELEKSRKPYDACLPPSHCPLEMYEGVENLSEASGLSKAEIIRQAVALFLHQNSTNVESQIKKNGIHVNSN